MTRFTPCQCPEARLLREWLHDPWSVPDRDLFPVLHLLADLLNWQRLRQTSRDLSAAADWASIAAGHTTHAELARHRAQPGPLARTVDRQAAAQWAATGHTPTHNQPPRRDAA